MRDYLDIPFKIKAVSEDGLFSGYGSVFGVVDSYQEVVANGAFKESLDARTPSLLWQHRSGEPIGVYTTVKEDNIGLYVEGKLALKTARGAEAYELLKMGAISGLSIGFVTREDSYDRVTGVRTLKKVDLWEVSLVTFPANDAARVASVKSIESIKSLADAEAYLREAGGLGKREAVAMLARIKSLQGRSESDGLGELKALIQRNTSLLTF
ncbi:HK97 family phage prohead protease [Malikia sp.]|uniref:HK97 family phage prohead protease n=1 Tax=Malikia sp. TaxID=2070706 RepID=UPI002613CEDE|nr:HK97 family phage prohead protease [Malikia sp.]MDD2728315.1 HK97 family phage prohead protease [Malikia sp.]